MSISLSGKVALVTGGSRGIGRACCLCLGEFGAAVAVNYAKNERAAQDVVGLLQSQGINAQAFQFDVSSSEQVGEGIKSIVQHFGSLDILVNNAGIAEDGLLLRVKDEDWSRTIETNLSSAFYCARAAAKVMLKARWGRIINISSVIGESGNAGQVAYAASKSGMFGLTKSLARELGGRGITVNTVTPGYIDTDMTAGINDDYRKLLLERIPLGRLGTAEDVAMLVGFLASSYADYITGQTVGVNGGMHM